MIHSEMMVNGLRYVIRETQNRKGRPRVYFCCLENDFEPLFEPIAADILEIQGNAAVWYRDPKHGIDDEDGLLEDLSEMQLFVVPVTGGFLRTPNHARTVELELAKKKHIPILPLMMEPGLADEFNRTVGDLQFLDSTAEQTDPTVLSYGEKMKKFIGSVLVGDETAQKVRDAFDAYIFLSYRKKDRTAAQQVMRLIHSDDTLSDIAIWYDEFLTPGENFNNEIEEAMKKSRLFALVVTPSLLENPNYVQKTEYPAARMMSLPVLPVEITETDPHRLKEMYEGIGDCIPADRTGNVVNRLRDLLKGIRPGVNKGKPAHDYLIGLAYLSGIDVEVNNERALDLLKKSAEGGVPDAYRKLVVMYRTGEGVERNYHTAIQWQHRFAAMLLEKAKKEDSLSAYKDLFDALFELGEYQTEAGETADARETLELAADVGTLIEQKGLFEGYHYRFAACHRLGALCFGEKDLEAAEKWHTQSMLCAMMTQVDRKRDLFIARNSLADISLAKGDYAEAKEQVGKAAQICREMDEDESPDAQMDLFHCYMQMGKICQVAGEMQEAADWYRKALEICRKRAEDTGDPETRRQLTVCLNRLGWISGQTGDRQGAQELLQQGMHIAREAAEKTGTVEARRDLAINSYRLGDLCMGKKDLEGARKRYEESLEICEELAGETDSLTDRQIMAIVCLRMGSLCSEEEDYEKAREWLERSREISLALWEKTGSAEFCRDLCIAEWMMAENAIRSGSYIEATGILGNCIERAEAEAEKSGSIDILRVLANAYEERGDMIADTLNAFEAGGWYIKEAETREKIWEKTKTDSFAEPLIRCLLRLGKQMGVSRRKRRNALERAAEVSGELYGRTKDAKYRELRDKAQKALNEM